MERLLAENYLHFWSQIGITEELIVERNLPLFEEAEELQIAEVSANGKDFLLTPQAADAWRNMKAAASRDGIEIYIVSAYRSVELQVKLIRNKLRAGQAIEDILKVLAPPGCSEHHTGRAVDLGSGEVRPLERDFELTPAFAWLGQRAKQYGFQLSFPEGNEYGYIYEPWHWCYLETVIHQVATTGQRNTRG